MNALYQEQLVPILRIASASHNRLTEAWLNLTMSSQVQKASAFPNWSRDSALSLRMCNTPIPVLSEQEVNMA